VGEHPRLALAHEDLEVEVSRRRRIRPVELFAAVAALGGRTSRSAHGAIVKGEHGLPIRERSYRKWFRQIARAAGIPDAVWSMDSRAGGATEAEQAGAEIDAIQGALTHSKKDTTLRYIRRSSKKIADVAEARNRKRAADDGGTA
jgi:integrase